MYDEKPKKDFFDKVSPFIRKYIKPFFDWSKENRFYTLLILFFFIVIMLFFNFLSTFLKSVIIISFLIFIGGISNIYQRYIKVHLGVEFMMLAAVLSGYVYGAFIGGFVGLTTFILGMYFEGRMSHTHSISFILMTLVGVFAHSFANASITTAGITLTILYDLILVPVYIGWFRARIPAIVVFAVTHIIWNWWVFTKVAPNLLPLLK